MTLRYVDKFENNGGTVSFTFPTNRYEWDSSQAINQGLVEPVGGSYAHDFNLKQKRVAAETFRWLAFESSEANLEAELDEMRQKLYTIGRGKLWMLNSDASRRWAYARLGDMPEVRIGPKQNWHAPVIVKFLRLSDWYSNTATVSGPTTVTTSPRTITVNNPGNAAVMNAIILVEANAAAGITNLQIENSTNGFTFATTRDSAAGADSLEIDGGAWSVLFNGANDFDKVTLGTAQVGIMQLEPGNNDLIFTCAGTPNYDVTITFYPAYH